MLYHVAGDLGFRVNSTNRKLEKIIHTGLDADHIPFSLPTTRKQL